MNVKQASEQMRIEDGDASNCVAHALVCGEEDFGSPSGLQHALTTMERLAEPSFDTEKKSSVCVIWANFYHEALKQYHYSPIFARQDVGNEPVFHALFWGWTKIEESGVEDEIVVEL